MKYKNTMLIVSDMDQSIHFYREILGLHVIYELGGKAILTSGICLQTLETWKNLIHKDDNEIRLMNYASELDFEIEDIDEFMKKLNQYNVPLLHALKEQAWGQRSVRFYDPDGHIIEVSESMKKVVKRYLSQGLSHEDIAKRMNVPLDFIKRILTHG